MGKRVSQLTAVLLAVFASSAIGQPQGEETRIGQLPAGQAVVRIAFSMDGKHVGFAQVQPAVVIVGDKTYSGHASISWGPDFSPDGRSVVFGAQDPMLKEFIVWGDKTYGAQFGRAWSGVLDPSGQRLAFVALRGQKQFVVVGDKKGEEFDVVATPPKWSPDGGIVAYVALNLTDGAKQFVVFGETKSEAFDEIGSFAWMNGQTVAVAGRNGQQWVVLVGKERLGPYDKVEHLRCSPAGVAYATTDARAGTATVHMGTWTSAAYRAIDDIAVSGDGKTIAFLARSQDTQERVLVVGNAATPIPNDWVPVASTLVLCHSGAKAAFASTSGADWFVALGNVKSPSFGAREMKKVSSPIVFSDDCSKISFGVCRGSDLIWYSMKP